MNLSGYPQHLSFLAMTRAPRGYMANPGKQRVKTCPSCPVNDSLILGHYLAFAADALNRLDGNRILRHPQSFAHMRSDYFSRDRTMIGLLLAAAIGLLLVTAFGIAGLASFWVQQRRRSIDIRRAIGATRSDILRYFQTENFLIVGLGIALGIALACVLNALLMQRYELPRLPLAYLPIGAVALWLLGQFAVLGPALRAAAVPPMVATRSI
jgi:putative ABC transport system permease protein